MELLKKEDPDLEKKFRKLCDIMKGYEGGVIAFSGGVDSSLLAFLGHHLLSKSLAVTADSPTLPRSELSEAEKFAKLYDINHRIISHNELEDPRFVKNDEQRCFFCKDGLFAVLNEIREKEGYDHVIDGSNFDDLDDFRPGREAAKENKVRSPLIQAELGKRDIRAISKALNLPTWDKPQMACLSSRFPRNMNINEEDLKKVEEAENAVKELGYKDVRVRIHGDLARIEIGGDEDIDLKELKELVPKIKELGFKYVSLDLEGYRTGSLNE
ncbi:MAG: ATP-dependent sacrificial sulfur transferase LarE [Thermoplasmata archaeon]|nr:MAG: ATP-dependent sacrificial sulfur transferase LarE [Thermoplasmata archaeon]